MIGAGTIGNDLTLGDSLVLEHDRLLVYTSVLVRALELGELVNIAAHFARQLPGMMLAFDPHDDALGVHGIDDAVTLAQYDRSRVSRGNAFHSRAHERGFRTQQGN